MVLFLVGSMTEVFLTDWYTGVEIIYDVRLSLPQVVKGLDYT